MPVGFAAFGVSCVNCGRSIHMLGQAIPALPDPIPVTCPFCDHNALYAKSSIHFLKGNLKGDGFGTVKTTSAIPSWQMLGIFALVIVLIVIAILTSNNGQALIHR